ncbi:WYL domain-containing protein [Methylobacter sp. BlB1]|uniref:WYL domain-containing protein n=1 Tax=unclassified Methylobacter TaxID=2635283 RepID=UPI00189623CB|nr:WYL domain-containing protein [Methylobacter sp. BlB1]MBF6650092.1 WYL domain-containing protein [Methylobacter sp. BlB1]
MNLMISFRPSDNSLKWDTRQRLALLEATALWEGRVTTGSLMQLFGISRGQASKDFTLYRQLASGNLYYDPQQKAYFPCNNFTPRFMRGSAEEYFRLVEAGSCLGQSVVLPIVPTGIGVELLSAPERKLDFPDLRLIHQAIREKRQIKVCYQSLTSPAKYLTLEPHTLVFNGFRWHIRAFSREHEDYRDFVLARFISTPELGENAASGVNDDVDWNRFDTLILTPHPGLSPEQQTVIADDFGMVNGKLHLNVRRALKLYVLRMLHLDVEHDDPKVQQIVWLNRGVSADDTLGANHD